jgi:hypothetical protein
MHAMRKMPPPVFWLSLGLAVAHAAGPGTPSDGAQVVGGAALSASAVIGSLSLTGSETISLPQRDRSGRANDGEPPATASLAVLGGQMYLTLRTSGSRATDPLKLAVIFWNRGAQPLAPPSVAFVDSAPGVPPALGGRVLAAAAQGGPRFLRSAGVWQTLGASAVAAWDAQGATVTLNIPIAALNELCPDGPLLDVRVLDGQRLYSYGPAANWAEPPDPARAFVFNVEQPLAGSSPPGRLAALVAAAGARPTQPGPQLWVLSRQPLPLEIDTCEQCAAVDQARELAERGETAAAVEASLAIIEADGVSDAALVPALRALAMALSKAKIQLSDSTGAGPELRLRFLKAVQDGNSRAAYGADLLVFQDMLPAARALLEEVVANAAAPAPARAHALLRLEQLSVQTGDWPAALAIAERLSAEAPFDTALREDSLNLLAPDGAPDRLPADLEAKVGTLRSTLLADRLAICRQYFETAVASGGSGSCPEFPMEKR